VQEDGITDGVERLGPLAPRLLDLAPVLLEVLEHEEQRMAPRFLARQRRRCGGRRGVVLRPSSPVAFG
jgi:hypothetical protein